MIMNCVFFALVLTAVIPSLVRGQVEDLRSQYRSYTFVRGNFTNYSNRFVDPWVVYVAATGRMFDDKLKETVKLTAFKYRGLVKVGLLYVSSKDDDILRKYAGMGFTEMTEDWILCLPYGFDRNTSSAHRSLNRAFQRCLRSIPANVHTASSLYDLNELTFNGVVKFSPARFVFLALTPQELPLLKVAAQRYKSFFTFAIMNPKLLTAAVAAEYGIPMGDDPPDPLLLLFMEREPGRGLVKRSLAIGAVSKLTSYPDLMELLFLVNIRYRRRLPGLHPDPDVCDPNRYMVGIMAVEKKWFPRFVQALDNAIGCGSLVRKKLDSMTVNTAPSKATIPKRTDL